MNNKEIELLKVQTAETILDRLKDFLPAQTVTELSLAFAIRPSVAICCTVNEIIKTYNSTQDNEDKVTQLLEKLLQIHFSARGATLAKNLTSILNLNQ